MKFINKALLFLTLLSDSYYRVNSHGIQVRYCQTNDDKLRILVEHWHGDLSNPSTAGTMSIQDANGTTDLTPNGVINNKNSVSISQAADCAGNTSIEASRCTSENPKGDWVYYDFLNDCSLASPPAYTLLSGNTVYLTEACDNLYPTTISLAQACNVLTQPPSVSPSMVPSSMPSSMPSWLDDEQCKKRDPENDICAELDGRCKLDCVDDEDFVCVPGLCSYDRYWDKMTKSPKSPKSPNMRALMEEDAEVVEMEITADGDIERKLKATKAPSDKGKGSKKTSKAPKTTKAPKSSCACRVPRTNKCN